MDRWQSNNDLNINRYFQKNIDRWLVILKMCDISSPMFIDLTKIYRTKKHQFWKSNCQNRLKSTKICKPRYWSIFFYLSNHRFINLEILQIPKSPFLLMVFEFFHVFHVESDSIDEYRCANLDIDRFSLLTASIYWISDPSNSHKPRFVEVE